ncbi:MAG: hypothetical protein ACRYHQ_31840 [Janthinobacterium lividum]
MKAMDRKPANAFVTVRKGFCYLTIKLFGRHHEMMRVRGYKIDTDEKRQMRRLYPEVAFDWKRITQQLAEKREDCRRYRTRSRRLAGRSAWRNGEPVFGIYEPGTRTIYTSGIPSTATGVGRLLDAVLQLDRERSGTPSLQDDAREPAEPGPVLVQDGNSSEPQ